MARTIPSSSFNNINYANSVLRASQIFEQDSFSFEPTISGSGYQVRVRSTTPAITSDPSPPFEAYFYDGSTLAVFTDNDINFEINKDPSDSRGPFANVSICATDGGTNSFTLTAFHVTTINSPREEVETPATSYIWYRKPFNSGIDDFVIIPGETGPNLVVTEEAQYQVSFDLGSCTNRFKNSGQAFSPIINVRVEGDDSTEIINQFNEVVSATPNPISLCQNDELRLIPEPNLTATTYRWFRDGNPLDTGGSSTLIVGDGGNIVVIPGVYRLEATSDGGCISSVEVSVETKNPQVSIDKPDVVVVEAGGSVTLNAITSTAGNLQWFKGGFLLSGATGSSLEVPSEEIDDYQVRLSAVSECGTSTFSQTVTVFVANSYDIVIDFQDPAIGGCDVESRTLVIQEIIATGLDNNAQPVTATLAPAAYESLSLNWQRGGTDITDNANGVTYDVIDLSQVGLYTLRIGSSVSNELDVNLRVSISELTPSSEFLCFDSSLTISGFGDAFTYRWFFNGSEISGETTSDIQITEPGIYQAEVTSPVCGTNLTDELTIALFGEGVISVDPGFSINMGQQESLVMTASGGESYEWFRITKDANGNITSEDLLSIEDNLEIFSTIFEEGQIIFYQLRSQVGDCVVANEITVRRELSDVIPNLITVNGDNINDRWVIPSEFVDKEEVLITIYDTSGKEDFKTNRYQNNWPEGVSSTQGGKAVYYYIIENQSNGQTEKGSITVMR